jgi:hypothetical protein
MWSEPQLEGANIALPKTGNDRQLRSASQGPLGKTELAEKQEVTAMKPNKDPVTKSPEGIAHEDIAVRAYRLWEERGSRVGSPEEDWFRAEQEIRSEKAQSQRAGTAAAKAQGASA